MKMVGRLCVRTVLKDEYGINLNLGGQYIVLMTMGPMSKKSLTAMEFSSSSDIFSNLRSFFINIAAQDHCPFDFAKDVYP